MADYKRPRIGDNNLYNRDRSGSNRYNDNGNRDAFDTSIVNDYQSKWITEGADCDLVKFAEKVGKSMADGGLTNSKIRSIYGEIKRIQSGDFEKLKSSFYLLKPKVAYALGRDKNNVGLQLFKKIFDRCYTDVKDKRTYENFCNFIEAMLAYHKAFGGKD